MEMPKSFADFLNSSAIFDEFARESDHSIDEVIDVNVSDYVQSIKKLGCVSGVIISKMARIPELGGILNIWNILKPEVIGEDHKERNKKLAALFQLSSELEYDLGSEMITSISSIDEDRVASVLSRTARPGFDTRFIDFEIEDSLHP